MPEVDEWGEQQNSKKKLAEAWIVILFDLEYSGLSNMQKKWAKICTFFFFP